MPRSGLLVIFAACFGLLAIPLSSAAGPPPTAAQLRAEDADLAAKSRSAVLGLYSLDSRLSAAQRRLTALQAEAGRLRAERASIGRQIQLARLDTRLSRSRLASRLRFLYEHGNTSSLDVLMGAKSLEDAITQLDDFNRVAAVNADVLTQVLAAEGHLSRLSHELRARAKALTATTLAAAATVSELGSERAQRAAYIGQLETQRSLDAAQIAQLDARARAAEALSQRLTLAAPTPPPAPAFSLEAAPAPAAPVVAGGRSLTVLATGYDLSGTTSTGLPVGWGVAAVDPSVIPLGTHLVIPGYGEAIAADTGSAIVGSTIDLWFPTPAQANAWGRRTITVALH